MSVTAKYWNGESSLRLIASGKPDLALRCPPKCWRTSRPSDRSGVAVRPSRHAGPDVVEQSLVARRGGVVELVDDDVFVAIGGQFVERPALVALDRDEQMVELARLAAADQEVAEVGVAENVAEGPQALLEATPRGGRRREAEASGLSPKVARVTQWR